MSPAQATFLERLAARRGPLNLLLLPLAGLFLLLGAARRLAYRLGLIRATRLPVPVVVVGNVTAGGSGKTPLVIWLARQLAAAGWRPGVISRGHGGSAREPTPATPDADPARVGDEPVLIARATGAPVWVGRRRAEAGRALLAAHPEVDVLLADDGLQHYALARDVEIAVVDGRRRFGNGWPLPAGPLREPVSRLARVDAVVVNGGEGGGDWRPPAGPTPSYAMRLVPGPFRALTDPARTRAASDFRGASVHAVAGIGDPRRFFDTLGGLGLRVMCHPFPDHHAYRPGDLPAGTLVMTAKDAVKCVAFGLPDAWVLEVDAVVEGGLKDVLTDKLGAPHGRETA